MYFAIPHAIDHSRWSTSYRTTCFPFGFSTVTEAVTAFTEVSCVALIKKFSPTAHHIETQKKKSNVLPHSSHKQHAAAPVHSDSALTAYCNEISAWKKLCVRTVNECDQFHRSFQMGKESQSSESSAEGYFDRFMFFFVIFFMFCIEFGLLKTLCYLVRSPAGLAILNFYANADTIARAMENKIVIIFIIFFRNGMFAVRRMKKKLNFCNGIIERFCVILFVSQRRRFETTGWQVVFEHLYFQNIKVFKIHLHLMGWNRLSVAWICLYNTYWLLNRNDLCTGSWNRSHFSLA